MKFLIIAACLTVCYAGKLDNVYLPPGNARTAGGNSNFLSAPRGFAHNSAAPAPSSVSSQPNIPILKADSEINVDGSFHYEYETGNGISAQEAGQLRQSGQEDLNTVQGAFSYTGDDGQQYTITYSADENGFQPQGAHIPTPPPVPEAILKALEQNAADEARGIVDDGSYKQEGGAAAAGKQYLAPKAGSNGQPGYRY